MKIKNEKNESASSPTKIITVQVFCLWLYFFVLFKITHFLYQRKSSGKGERGQRSRWEEAGLQTGLLECYGCSDWESTGEEVCRKQGAGAVTEEGGLTGLEPPYDSG